MGLRPGDSMTRNARILLGWATVSLIVGPGCLYLFNPLAGLSSLLLVLSGVALLIAPVVHIAIASKQQKSTDGPTSGMILVFGVVGFIALFVLLTATGWFNFT